MLILNKGNEKQNKVEIVFALFWNFIRGRLFRTQSNFRIFQTRKLFLSKFNIFVVHKIFQRLMDGCKGWFAVGCCRL